ncbi:MAG: hypothetical protein Q9208_002893 [Pyrenodesmia sp. 3 TL-2023]
MASMLTEFFPVIEDDALYLIRDPRSELNHFQPAGGSSLLRRDDPEPMDFQDFVASVAPVPARHRLDTSTIATKSEYPSPTRAAGNNASTSPKWHNAMAFARTLAVEAAKGSAFEEGMAALNNTIRYHVDHHPTPQHLAMAATVTRIHKATSTLLRITSDWFEWSQAHYNQKERFGAVHLAGFTILNFVVFQSNIGELSEALDGDVTPLVEDARIFKTEECVEGVREAMARYCGSVRELANEARANGAMMGAGFDAHDGGVEEAARCLA